MAGNDFGGRITFALSTGTRLSLRGTFSVDPADQSNEAQTNQDGSLDRIGKPESPSCEINFADNNSIDYSQLMKSGRFNVTAIEDFTGVTHYYTGCIVVGKPTINRMNGEVTGCSISATSYSRSVG